MSQNIRSLEKQLKESRHIFQLRLHQPIPSKHQYSQVTQPENGSVLQLRKFKRSEAKAIHIGPLQTKGYFRHLRIPGTRLRQQNQSGKSDLIRN